MKKKESYPAIEEFVWSAFVTGMRLGFSLGNLSHRVAPKLIGRSQKEIRKLLQLEIDAIFKLPFKKRGGDSNAKKS